MQQSCWGPKGIEMLSWLPRRPPRLASIEVEAEALVAEFGDRTHSEVRRKEGEASSDHIAALAVAAKTGRRVGLDLARRPISKRGLEGSRG
jgi:hypothetical protein